MSSTFLLRIKQGSLVNALELSQQMSMLVDLKLLQEKIDKGLKKKYPDNLSYSLILPHDTDVKRLGEHLKTPYNKDKQILADSFEGTMFRKVETLAEVIKQTRGITDGKAEQDNTEDFKNAKEQLNQSFGAE